MISSIFEKLYGNFSICHAHPNNSCGVASLNGIEIPRVMEVTFLRNDLVEKFKSKSSISLPHKLDRKNVKKNNDLEMPRSWWIG